MTKLQELLNIPSPLPKEQDDILKSLEFKWEFDYYEGRYCYRRQPGHNNGDDMDIVLCGDDLKYAISPYIKFIWVQYDSCRGDGLSEQFKTFDELINFLREKSDDANS